jgi:hypothetical protein
MNAFQQIEFNINIFMKTKLMKNREEMDFITIIISTYLSSKDDLLNDSLIKLLEIIYCETDMKIINNLDLIYNNLAEGFRANNRLNEKYFLKILLILKVRIKNII